MKCKTKAKDGPGAARRAWNAFMAVALVVGLLPVTTLATAQPEAYADGDASGFTSIQQLIDEFDTEKGSDEPSVTGIDELIAQAAGETDLPLQGAEKPEATVFLHFKDTGGQTIDLHSYSAPVAKEGDFLYITVNDDPQELDYSDNLKYGVYDHYATFDERQVNITGECSYDPVNGKVVVPAAYEDVIGDMGIVFELSPTHPAYEKYVLSELDTSPLEIEGEDGTVTLESDVPDILAQAQAAERPSKMMRAAVSFPSVKNKHFQLNPYTRLENFDVDMPKKQAAYGFPSAMIGSYGFGVLFGSHQDYKDGVSTGTTWDKTVTVLDEDDSSYNEDLEEFLAERIKADRGDETTFAISRSGDTYRDRYITTGKTYQDSGYSQGEAPNNKAMAHATCGSADVNNGYGALMSDHSGDNYIVYKGKYSGDQTKYKGWLKFYYKFDAKSAANGATFQDVVGYLLVEGYTTGKAQVKKVSADTSITDGNSSYSLKSAVFAGFATKSAAQAASKKAQAGEWETWRDARDWAKEEAEFYMVTKEDGTSNEADDIDEDTYYVAELFAPKGYKLNTTVKSCVVKAEETTTVNFADEPEYGAIDVLKKPLRPSLANGNPNYSIDGAVYTVFSDSGCTKAYGTITVRLQGDGTAYGKLDKVPVGKYWVKETTRAKAGYACDTTVYPVTVIDSDTARVSRSASVDYVNENEKLDPINIFLQKIDKETGKPVASGGASLGDAHYEIKYYNQGDDLELDATKNLTPTRKWVVRTDDDGTFFLSYAEDSFIHENRDGSTTVMSYKVSGDSFDKLENGAIGMPIGTYVITEVKAPEGYLIDPTPHVRHITDTNSDSPILNTYNEAEGGDSFDESPIRTDIDLNKTASGKKRLGYVPWKVTSKKTGEWHILVCDSRGYASTAYDMNAKTTPQNRPHSLNTNANDAQFRAADGSFKMPASGVDMSKLDTTSGIWFGTDPDTGAQLPVDDAKGALPYDEYILEEIECPINSLFDMINDEFAVEEYDEGGIIHLGQYDNEPKGTTSIGTIARDGADGDNQVIADRTAKIIDRVEYKGLEVGNAYKLSATLMDRATGEAVTDAGGCPVTVEYAFTAKDAEGYTEVEITFDASALGGHDVVVFEKLYDAEGSEIASHEDITDFYQTVKVKAPEIGTTLTDGDGGKAVYVGGKVVLTDTVSYKNMPAGKELIAKGALVVKGDEGSFTELLDADGNPVTAEATFTPEGNEGTVDVTFEFDGTVIEGGMELVAFEKVLDVDFTLATHEDPEDEGQTVAVETPEIGTTLTDGDGGKAVYVGSTIRLADTIAYKNMPVGVELTAKGKLVVKGEDGGFTELLDTEGNPVTAEAVFTPEAHEGTVEVTFEFDGSLIEGGMELVAFERVLAADLELATHEDPSDEGQTVEVETPKVGTTLVDGLDGDKIVSPDVKVILVDTVAYENVAAGSELRAAGTLMQRVPGGEIAPLTDAAGDPVTAEAVFTAEETSGTAVVTFEFDGSALGESVDLVAYEELYLGSRLIASHEDPDDEGQTVTTVGPSIGTTAYDKSDGDKVIEAAPDVTVADTIAYDMLVPGKTYTVSGTLMAKGEDGAIAPLIDAQGNAVTATAEFTPEAASGTTEVEFTLDATGLEGAVLVAYEQLSVDGRVVAVHEDPDDEGQTVTVETPEIGTELTDATDGDHTALPSRKAKLTDTVSYTGLVPGTEYVMRGILMDKETGKPLSVGDAPVVAEKRFTPNKASGTVDIEFEFDASALAGKTVVAFEELQKDGRTVAVHADIDDEGQSVEFEGTELPGTGGTPGSFAKTGADMLPYLALGGLLIGIGIALVMLRRRSGKDSE